MSETIRILIADDHAVVRQGLRALITTEPGMELAGEARDGDEAVTRANTLRPDVILLDLNMPRKDGLMAIREITAEQPNARILVLTSFADDDQVFGAIKAGALGYLLKETEPDELLRAIRDVARGESSLHPSIARKLILELNRPPKEPRGEMLSEREVDVLRLVAQGLANEEIGQRLFISEPTVRAHVSNILSKLHLSNRTQAALYALRAGLATLESG
jgi:two-component system, NarL family, response regulator LiaR